MPSEWATSKAAHLATVLDAQSAQHQSARILAESLDAARLEGRLAGLDEAAEIIFDESGLGADIGIRDRIREVRGE